MGPGSTPTTPVSSGTSSVPPVSPDSNASFPTLSGPSYADANRCTVQQFLDVDRQFVIPKNQRLFTWEDTQINQLWEDLAWHLEAETGDLYSLGTIETVIVSGGGTVPINSGAAGPPARIPQLEIQDGQQRLTTFCLFGLAFAQSYGDRGFLNTMREKILRDDGSGNFQPLLKYNETNLDECFRLLCSQGHIRGYTGQKSSHIRRLKAAYELLCTKFDGLPSPSDKVNMFNHFMGYTELVHLCSDANPHIVFETRNNRGKKLGSLDLVKNFIERIDHASTVRSLAAGPPTPPAPYNLNFGVMKWYPAMEKRDESKLNRKTPALSVNEQKRGEDALFKRAMTAAFGYNESKFSDFRSKFKVLIDEDDTVAESDLRLFISAFTDMSVAMADVLEPATGWLTYGRLTKWSSVPDFGQKRGHVLALLGDLFARLDLEVRWAPVVLTMYHKLQSIDEFIRCLHQIEKAAFRIYRYRANSKTSFAAAPLCELAKVIYNWGRSESALVNHILCEVGRLCLVEANGTGLEKIYQNLSRGTDHYNAKWSLYLLYHYEVAQYHSLLLGSVTKNWQYNTSGGKAYYTGNYTFQKEHIMPNKLGGTPPIRTTTMPKWDSSLISTQNNAHEPIDNSSYWIRTGPNYPWFNWDNTNQRTLKSSHDDFSAFAQKIGNLVLSKSNANNTYSNHPYKREPSEATSVNQKSTLYLRISDFRRVKNIPRIYTDWNKRTIEDRSQRIARWAIQRFRLEQPTSCTTWQEDDVDCPAIPFIPEHTSAFREIRTQAWNAKQARDAAEAAEEEVNVEPVPVGEPMMEDPNEGGEANEGPLEIGQPPVVIEIPEDGHPTHEPPIELPEEIPGYDFPEDYYDPDLHLETE